MSVERKVQYSIGGILWHSQRRQQEHKVLAQRHKDTATCPAAHKHSSHARRFVAVAPARYSPAQSPPTRNLLHPNTALDDINNTRPPRITRRRRDSRRGRVGASTVTSVAIDPRPSCSHRPNGTVVCQREARSVTAMATDRNAAPCAAAKPVIAGGHTTP